MRSSGFTQGLRGLLGSRRSLTLALALSVAVPATGWAQGSPKSYKKWYLAIGGAIAVGIPAYAFTSESGFNSACSSKECVGMVAALIGGAIGFLVGTEMDRTYARRMAAGPTLNYSFLDVPLDLVPDRMKGFPGGAAVIGVGGARIIRADGSVASRGVGVRGIEDLAVLPAPDLLVLSTFSNLLSFSIQSDTAQGQVIDERGGGRLADFQGNLAVAGFDSLRLLSIGRTDGDVAVRALASLENLDFVTDMEYSSARRIGWVLMENRLAAYRADLEKIGEVELPAAGRSVRADGNRLAVAAGTNGVYVLDATDPADPRVVQHYSGARFAYAADLEGEYLYVAAGAEGVPMIDISGEVPRVVGVARELRFVTDVVVSGPGQVWILDRDGQSVQIADFGLEREADDDDSR
jgi:hypothetical protein